MLTRIISVSAFHASVLIVCLLSGCNRSTETDSSYPWGEVSHAQQPFGADLRGDRIDFNGFRARIFPRKKVWRSNERVRFTLEIQNVDKETNYLYWNSRFTACLSYKTEGGGARFMTGHAVSNERTSLKIEKFTNSNDGGWERGTIVMPGGEVQQFDIFLGFTGRGTLAPGEHVFECEYRLFPITGADYTGSDRRIVLPPIKVVVKE